MPHGTSPPARIDVHQHLWPPELVEALRSRHRSPRLIGWTLLLPGEAPYQVQPLDHDLAARQDLEPATEMALVSLSSPMGIEDLRPGEALPLLDAWHDGAASLPSPFAPWAAVSRLDPDLGGLKDRLAQGFAGLQVPATWLATPQALERCAPALEICERGGRPVFVHPGPVSASPEGSGDRPAWWPAVVDYSAQLQAAWWSWHTAGRALLPQLRICFAAGAGLAPLQHERLTARGGAPGPVDEAVFVDTSSHGPQAIDALIRARGIDTLVLGSDRPYAGPADLRDFGMGAAAAHAVEVANPRRLLRGGTP